MGREEKEKASIVDSVPNNDSQEEMDDVREIDGGTEVNVRNGQIKTADVAQSSNAPNDDESLRNYDLCSLDEDSSSKQSSIEASNKVVKSKGSTNKLTRSRGLKDLLTSSVNDLNAAEGEEGEGEDGGTVCWVTAEENKALAQDVSDCSCSRIFTYKA